MSTGTFNPGVELCAVAWITPLIQRRGQGLGGEFFCKRRGKLWPPLGARSLVRASYVGLGGGGRRGWTGARRDLGDDEPSILGNRSESEGTWEG